MTRSNLYITLSNGKKLQCVVESDSAPEQGYIVEELIIPLLNCNNAMKETALLNEHCTMNELRANTTYRYTIDLVRKEVLVHKESYNYSKDIFNLGIDITKRYNHYLMVLQNKFNNN